MQKHSHREGSLKLDAIIIDGIGDDALWTMNFCGYRVVIEEFIMRLCRVFLARLRDKVHVFMKRLSVATILPETNTIA